jgi:hypothetical protein
MLGFFHARKGLEKVACSFAKKSDNLYRICKIQVPSTAQLDKQKALSCK